MTMSDISAILEQLQEFQGILRSIHAFDSAAVLGTVHSITSPTDYEDCLSAPYLRVVANVRTLLALPEPAHFQAHEMIARAIFELAVDVKLVEMNPDCAPKVRLAVQYERLRSAKKVIKFANETNQIIDL